MRNTFFPGWGRPYEFNSQLLARVGRGEEARDVVSLLVAPGWLGGVAVQLVARVGRGEEACDVVRAWREAGLPMLLVDAFSVQLPLLRWPSPSIT